MTHFIYTTMFDSGYGAKGMSLIESIQRRARAGADEVKPQGYVLALDDKIAGVVRANADALGVVYCRTLDEMLAEPYVGERLRKAKGDRTYQEFCWSLASLWTDHIMAGYMRDELLWYLDADVFFFDTPMRLIEEMRGKSIGLQPHAHVASEIKRLGKNGVYNIGTVAFRADQVGRTALKWWSDEVLNWCKYSEGDRARWQYCGDQGYADGIAEKWRKHVKEFGVGVSTAPWNVIMHTITDGPSTDGMPMINYHFHEFKNRDQMTNYQICMATERLVYAPYVESTERWQKVIG